MPPKSKRAKSSEQAIPSTTVDSDVDSPHSSWSEEVDDSNTTDSDSDDGSSTSSTSSVDSQMVGTCKNWTSVTVLLGRCL